MNEDEIQNFRFLFTSIKYFFENLNIYFYFYRISSSAKIYVITDKGILSCNSDLKRINDIIEVDSFILCVGEGSKIFKN
jgi:hypothetical protein